MAGWRVDHKTIGSKAECRAWQSISVQNAQEFQDLQLLWGDYRRSDDTATPRYDDFP